LTDCLVLIPTFLPRDRIIGAWRLYPGMDMVRCVLRITISAGVGGCIHCLVGPFDVGLHFVVRLDDESDEFRVLNTSRLCLADHFCT